MGNSQIGRKEVDKIWDRFDELETGNILPNDLESFVKQLGKLNGEPLSHEQTAKLYRLASEDRFGNLQYNAFISALENFISEKRQSAMTSSLKCQITIAKQQQHQKLSALPKQQQKPPGLVKGVPATPKQAQIVPESSVGSVHVIRSDAAKYAEKQEFKRVFFSFYYSLKFFNKLKYSSICCKLTTGYDRTPFNLTKGNYDDFTAYIIFNTSFNFTNFIFNIP
eukprot:CAMPEP_0201553074 /NCGR_PEP_ID=MMETSP0173_2-20130828/19426_1 /ASSEMBLY_ACC=CAM_ASM_000268 /TAXON_ID=218659 /ORGANISM="Vexillifera sp., Strain DIVA3 564/2" /LENGTH=222 /DNA_ID=CAMNT_0047963677 /DNA_START=6 /DNA_END=670 /DNA_ORIENTATION=-